MASAPASSHTASVGSMDVEHKAGVETSPAIPNEKELDAAAVKPAGGNPFKGKGRDFWLVFLSLCVSCFLSALDLTAVSTVIPTMAAALHSDKYAWLGTAYALASTALVPWTAGLANIFGRRATMVGSLVLFAVGSAVTGSAQTMEAAIAGRTVQGLGGGGILIMTDIIIVDMVPLIERGAYYGIVGSVWAFASAVGPPIGGALASSGNWRWLFYLNIPVAALALALVLIFFRLKTPKTTFKEKMDQMDYYNLLFVAATTSVVLGISWGGVEYGWSSYNVLVPLILGLAGLAVFIWIEKRFVKFPTVPFDILTFRTSVSGYVGTFLHGIVSVAVIYYLPLYFQSTKGASAIKSGIDLFALSFIIAPFAIICGISIGATGHYLVQNYIGWAFTLVGFGLLSLLHADSPTAAWAGYTVVTGIGLGLLYSAPNFPILAPLRPDQQPQAMGFFNFARSLGQVFGIAIGNTALTNQLRKRLPAVFLAAHGASAEAAIPFIQALAEPLRAQVKGAFADSLRVVWFVMLGISGAGLVSVLAMKSLPLTAETDEKWGLEERVRKEVEGGRV